MRVTHVITRLIVGGAQENTISSVLGLHQRSGWTVRLISGPTYGPEGSLEASVSSIPDLLTTVPQLIRPIHPAKDIIALKQLERIFCEQRPDIVHTHSGKAGLLGRLAAARAGVPVIIHTIHGPSFGPFQGPLTNRLLCAAERHAGKVTTHFVTVAQAMTEQYLAAGIGRRDQYTRIFSGFHMQPFLSAQNNPALRARYNLQPDDIIIGKIARLFKLKGHDDLFSVAPRLVKSNPRIRFLIVGDGEWRKRFEACARESGLEQHFVFTGLVPPDEIPALIGIMDIVVHLSLREGLPRALPQALAARRPVVAYDCDGASEVCQEGRTGFLVPPGDLNRLGDRLLQLAGNPALREQLGRTGSGFVQENFGVERMVDQLQALYQALSPKSKSES